MGSTGWTMRLQMVMKERRMTSGHINTCQQAPMGTEGSQSRGVAHPSGAALDSV